MIPAINGSLAAWIIAKVTVATASGLIAVTRAHRKRAAVRHALLAVSFSVILLLPIASVVVPPVQVKVPVMADSRAAELLRPGGATEILPVSTAAAARAISAIPPESGLSFYDLLLAGWIAGTAVFLLPVVVGLWQTRSVRRSGLPWRCGQAAIETLAPDSGLHRRVEVLLHETLPGPMTCGVLRPAILLPHDAESWKREDLNRAIVHELEHVRRGDWVSQIVARCACALYWFHPLVWAAWRRLSLEAERSCDDAVLAGSDATVCADQLVGLARRLTLAKRSPLVAMANRVDLATRVRAVLDVRQPRGRLGAFSVALACAAAVVLVTAMSPIMVVAAPQAAPVSTPKFEVASIKLNKSGRAGWDGFKISHGSFNVANASLQMLITGAFHLQNPRVSGGPAWFTTDRFDISAKGDSGVGDKQVFQMLQSLLIDRFGLVVHRETRDLPIYALVAAKNRSSRLHTADEASCHTPASESKGGGIDVMRAISCGDTAVVGGPQGGGLWGKSVSLSFVADALSDLTDRPVVDRTGIGGQFDFELRWSDGSPPVRNQNEVTRTTAPDSEAPPSIFVALQEQLGLKLEPARGPVEVLVIDHVDRPSDN